ncbi:MAG: isomerase [Deltaproteobacteria bacterium HGW-Deltaproteobacteria-19]|jgi:PhzF family phenazine biosynthesis protein|nr:MAG: isomerase [Deltaproteobacteria bacterium HGW-Deltaproteobacteria-19]
MQLPLYQVDAFTNHLFAGNPAAVCPLEEWPVDAVLQSIATENNLSETAFFSGRDGSYHLRWFTPAAEIDLCGHATLASACVIFRYLEPALNRAEFQTRSGILVVEKQGDLLAMDFPARPAEPCPLPEALAAGLGVAPLAVLRSRDYMAILDNEDTVRKLQPRMDELIRLDCTGIIATAPGRESDFVSRFFAPRVGVPEDPVTGSSHCTLIPYWSGRLGKKELHSVQVSPRGGQLFCTDLGDRVRIAGRAVTYLEGIIHIG